MCLLLFAYKVHPQFSFILAGNRDEFYDRPTANAHYWKDSPYVLGGRDLEKMGTWMGVSKDGKFAALTNYRDPNQPIDGKRSRGELVSNFLTKNQSVKDYSMDLQATKITLSKDKDVTFIERSFLNERNYNEQSFTFTINEDPL